MSNKPFMTYDQLLSKLDEKELVIPDREYALKQLKLHSYFALITGYKSPFKQKDGKYKRHASFNDIYALFMFDDSLRSLFLKYILKIENHFKSLISYSFCEKYGDLQQEYLNVTNYNYSPQNQVGINRLVSQLNDLASNNMKYPYINHYRNAHGNIPLWVMMKALTMGVVSTIYSYLKSDIQASVSTEFPVVTEGSLINILDLLSRVRNVCAHNERFFDYRYKKGQIDDLPVHAAMLSKGSMGHYRKGKCDLFAVVISFFYLLDRDEFSEFVNSLSNEMDLLFSKTNMINREMLYKYMGLPKNWKDIEKLQR